MPVLSPYVYFGLLLQSFLPTSERLWPVCWYYMLLASIPAQAC